MTHHNLTSPPRDLLWLRRLFTIFVLFGLYSASRSWRTLDAWHPVPSFAMLYHLVLLALIGIACVAAWRGHFRAFVSLVIVDRAISAFGALWFFLERALPSSYYYSSDHLEYNAWNLLSVALSTSILVYLFRKYPPEFPEIAGRKLGPITIRVLQAGSLLVALAIAVDIAPELQNHLTETNLHSYSCSELLVRTLVMALVACAFAASVWKKWSLFVWLSLVGQTLTAFDNFTQLTMDAFYDEAYNRVYAPIYLSRNLPVFAFALFTVVYLALRFPPRLTASPTPPASSAPAPAAG